MLTRIFLTFTFLWVPLVGLGGCASTGETKEDAEAVFKDAEDAFKDGRYLMAIEKYRDLRARYPYSQRAVESELRVADAHFALENFIEAEGAYEIFRELHPGNEKVEYAYFQIALCHFNQIPSSTARDLSAAHRALEAFEDLWQKFPSSQYVPKAKEYYAEARRKLAEHENYVAEFYFQRRHYLSASYRYAALLADYSGLGMDEQALFNLGKSYFEIRMYSNAQDALTRLMKDYPETTFRSGAEALLANIKAKKTS